MRKEDKTTEGTAAGVTPSAGRTLLGPLDVQQKEFRVSRFGGYKMRDVDEFLDVVTDSMSALVAENDRLRSGVSSPLVGSPDLDDVSRQADEIIQRARTEAARIVAEAKVLGSAGTGTPNDRAAVNAFLTKEREFLQSLAGLVQGHAETVKGMSKASKKPAVPTTDPSPDEASISRARADAEGPAATGTAATAGAAAGTAAAGTAAAASPAETQAQLPPPAEEAPSTEETASSSAQEATAVHEPVAEEPPTTVPESDAAVRVGEPEPAAMARKTDGDEAVEGDRSLRDLFWGED